MNQELVVAEKNRNRSLYKDSQGKIKEKNFRIAQLKNKVKIMRERIRSDSGNLNKKESSNDSQIERSCKTRSYDQVVRSQVCSNEIKERDELDRRISDQSMIDMACNSRIPFRPRRVIQSQRRGSSSRGIDSLC